MTAANMADLAPADAAVASSLAVISVTVGVFATHGPVLNSAGLEGVWRWVVAAVGRTLSLGDVDAT
jgi:hypothetical protein